MTHRLFLFDIDGTLLHGNGIGREATRRAMLEVFGRAGSIDMHHFGGKTDWFTLHSLLTADGLDESTISLEIARYETVIARHMQDLTGEYDVRMLAGALDVLSALRQRPEVLLGIVTGNVSTTAPVKLRAAGFDPEWFVVGAYGSESMNRDDLPRLALQRAIALQQAEIGPEAVVVIGDTVDDIQCARALGAVAVAVTTGFTAREDLIAAQPDHLLDSLPELLSVLAY